MTRNSAKIAEGIKNLTWRPYEVISGVVEAVNTGELTIDVMPDDSGHVIKGVVLSTHVEQTEGVIIVPKEGSNVIIASIDGPGMWCMLKSSEITQARITIKDVVYEMDETLVRIRNKDAGIDITDSVVKITTQNESLFKLLKDCFTYLTQLTVPTPAGASSVPTNVSDFANLLTRLNNLLNE